MRIFPLILAVMLAGCSSAAELAERDGRICSERGFAPYTSAHSYCLHELDRERQAARQAIAGGVAIGLDNYGALLQQQSIQPPIRFTHCYQSGTTITCFTY